MNSETIGEAIRMRRKERQVSQNYLAKRVGLTTAAICQYEKNKRVPSLDMLIKIMDELGYVVDFRPKI